MRVPEECGHPQLLFKLRTDENGAKHFFKCLYLVQLPLGSFLTDRYVAASISIFFSVPTFFGGTFRTGLNGSFFRPARGSSRPEPSPSLPC